MSVTSTTPSTSEPALVASALTGSNASTSGSTVLPAHPIAVHALGDGLFLQTKTAQGIAGVFVGLALFLTCSQVRRIVMILFFDCSSLCILYIKRRKIHTQLTNIIFLNLISHNYIFRRQFYY